MEFSGIDLAYNDINDYYTMCCCSIIEKNSTRSLNNICYTQTRGCFDDSIIDTIETYMGVFDNIIIDENFISEEDLEYLNYKSKEHKCRIWTVNCKKRDINYDIIASLSNHKIFNFPLEQPLKINVTYTGNLIIDKNQYNPLQNTLLNSCALANYGIDLLNREKHQRNVKKIWI